MTVPLRSDGRELPHLRARAAIDDRLHDLTARGTGLSGWVAAAAELTGKPAWLFDVRRRAVARSGGGPGGADESAIRALLAGRTSVPEPQVVRADPVRGPVRRVLLIAVRSGEDHFGWLALEEFRTTLGSLDDFVARRTAVRLGAEFAVQRRVAKVAWNARSALARQLVHGSSERQDLLASGEYLGVDVRARRVLVFVKHPDDTHLDEDALSDAVAQHLDTDVLATRGSEGTLLLVAVADDAAPTGAVTSVRAAVQDALTRLCPDTTVVAGVSAVAEVDALQRAYREAREVGLCIDRFTRPGGARVLSVSELGPARLFLAHSGSAAVQRYVDDLVGPLLDGRETSRDLLATLQCYFDSGRHIRVAAGRLGLHENTIRLRLGRVQACTGLDVAADPTDQLSVQTALMVLRLQGHPALPPLDGPSVDVPVPAVSAVAGRRTA